METYQVGLIALAITAIAVVLIYVSWRKKRVNQELLLDSPVFIREGEEGIRSFYVATVFKDRPLDRVVAHGMAHRGFAKVSIEPEGIALYRTGEKSILIPKTDFLGQAESSAVIDKAVEKDGLVVLNWKLGDQKLSTYLRFASSKNRNDFQSSLASGFGEVK